MARKLRFNIICSGESVRTIEELRENFSVKDVLELYHSGRLERWLDVQGYSGEKQKVSEMTAQGSLNIVKQLVSILGVSIEEQELKDQIYKEEHPVPSIEEILQADQEERKTLLNQLSKNGDAQLWYQMAERYNAGDGVEKDMEQATFWYTKANEQGHAKAKQCLEEMQREKAERISQQTPENSIVTKCRKAAERGDTGAQYQLGMMYKIGNGLPWDESKAKYWFEKSAAKGYTYAKQALEEMQREKEKTENISKSQRQYTQEHSKFTTVSTQKQAKYTTVSEFREAAERGNAEAQYQLGLMYQSGSNGLFQSYGLTKLWFTQAANQGHAKAKQCLEEMQRKKAEKISQQTSENDIVYKYRKAAEQGDIAAQYQLGLMYKMGAYGLTPDKGAAKYWLEKAAAKGHTWAMNELKKL